MILTQDQTMVRDAIRAFVQEQIWPHAPAWDKSRTFPKEVHRGLAQLGCYGICVPEELGGAGLNYQMLALVLEEIAAGDGGVSTTISVTNCPVTCPFSSMHLKNRYVKSHSHHTSLIAR